MVQSILEPEHQHLYHKILNLVMADGAYEEGTHTATLLGTPSSLMQISNYMPSSATRLTWPGCYCNDISESLVKKKKKVYLI